MRFLLIAVLCACGSKPAAAPTAAPAKGPSCPASFSAVTEGQDCAAPGPACTFPEGRCECVRGEDCKGTPSTRAELAELNRLRWHCERKRTDGCPTAPGGACPTEGVTCTYAGCCPDFYTCTSGIWTAHETACPP